MITLENDKLTAVIVNKGAELQQITHKQTGINYMWKGDAAYWGKYSPVLFPIVGGLKNDTYYYNDKAYKLPRHGFARDKTFVAEKLSETEAVFTLTQDEQTLTVYPFAFVLILRYQLNNNSLSCTYEVYNPGNDDLLFSVGAHPAFAVPITSDTDYDNYYLQFNTTERLHRWKLQEGLLASSSQLLPTTNNKLPLKAALFYEDAIVLKNLQSNCITLASNKHEHGFNFYFNGFDYFGIWAAKDAPFICLEPWCGIADSIKHNQQLTDKEGINELQPGESFVRTWSVECF
jgi:galactose mutarotase-like enzyme